MHSLLATIRLTVCTAIRNRSMRVLAGMACAGIIPIGFWIQGDGTAAGTVRLTLMYSLSYAGFLISAATLWSGCAVVAEDISSTRIQLAATKPVPRAVYWLGRWIGVVIANGAVLALSSVLIYVMVMQRLQRNDYTAEELAIIYNEILTGRVLIAAAATDAPDRADIPGATARSHGPAGDALRSSAVEIPVNGTHTWTFVGIVAGAAADGLHLRCRFYVGDPMDRIRRTTDGIWWVRNPKSGIFDPAPGAYASGRFHEVHVTGHAVDSEGRVTVTYENRDGNRNPVIIQAVDGPYVLVPSVGFATNFGCAVFLMFIQIMFLAALACCAGAMFSLTMAVFLSSSYVVIGILTMSLRVAMPETQHALPGNTISEIALIVRQLAGFATVALNDYYEIGRLVRGERIGFRIVAENALQLVVCRGIPLACLGIWYLRRRQLALAETE